MTLLKWLKMHRISVSLLPGNDVWVHAPDNLSTADRNLLKRKKPEILNHLRYNVNAWIDALKWCLAKEEVFKLLDEFKQVPNWTDNERALMAQAYHRRLGHLKN